jgi:hypothetical protein
MAGNVPLHGRNAANPLLFNSLAIKAAAGPTAAAKDIFQRVTLDGILDDGPYGPSDPWRSE